jgi:3-oxoadipate enol-lactonase
MEAKIRTNPTTIDRFPTLPEGRHVHLSGRGDTFVRELPGPAGAPTVLLLHGWTATADLNWQQSFAALGRQFRVVALDHRGHGRGLRTDDAFSLAACADDVAELICTLRLERVIVVGYSMGGPIAQLTWLRHRHLVAGIVLCATSQVFNETPRDQMMFSMLDRLAHMAGHRSMRGAVRKALQGLAAAKARTRLPGAWALEQIARHDWLAVLEAGRELGRFDSRSWLESVDVPAAVVATLDDDVVPLDRQMAMATAIAGASLHPIHAGHAACYDSETFVPALGEACRSVAARIAHAVDSRLQLAS